MTVLRSDPATLQSFADSRWAALRDGRPVSDDQIDAMTEAMLRLAVHPGTSRADAVDLLHRAHRAAPHDARFAYHLGRMALEDGKLAEAEAWLTVAHTAEPGNHRVATHLVVALRQQEAAQPVEAADARAGYRSRARVLSARIRAAGTPGCGWAGIYDLEFSVLIRLEAGEQALNQLRPVLTALRDLADRPGGVRAFAVASVLWLIRGYPVQGVEDLIDGLPAGDHRASYLLRLGCLLFGLPAEKLPARLADAVRNAELPEVLIALIHQRRLLPGVRAFPQLGALRAAQWFLTDDPPHGEAAHHVAMLDAAVAIMRTPPVALGNADSGNAGERTEAGDAVARLTTIEARLVELDEGRKALSEFIGGPLKATDRAAVTNDQMATVAADHALLTRTLDLLIADVTEAHEEATHLLGDLGHLGPADLGADFADRADAVRVALADRMSPGKMRRLLARIKNSGAGRPGAAPSPAAEALAARFGPKTVEATPEPQPVSPTDVGAAVRRSHAAVAEIFADAERTLQPYSDSAVRRHLHNLVLGRLAENQYRMSLIRSARRTWHRLLADHGPNPSVFRNLAVAALCGGDERHATTMWRRNLDELYRAAGTTSQRERLHGVLLAAYLPPGLRRDDASEDEAARTVRFLASERAIHAATVHLRGLHGGADDDGPKGTIEQTIRLKQRVERFLVAEVQWALGTTAVVIIANLGLIDRLPLDPDDGFAYQTALSLGIAEPAEGLTQLNALRDRAIRIAIGRILQDAARQDETTLPARYSTVLKAWVDSPISPEDSYPLDDPRSLYDARTTAAVTAAAEDPARRTPGLTGAQQTLHKWRALLPGVTGPARDLARLTDLHGDPEGAWRVLVHTTQAAVHPIGLEQATHQAAVIGWKLKHYPEVIDLTLDVVKRRPTETMWKLVEDVHLAAAATQRNRGIRSGQVVNRFERWSIRTVADRGPEFRDAAAEVLRHLREA